MSRTPSPQPQDGMDVDNDLPKYDEYVRGTAREVITVETKIKPTNKGFTMLAKLGWIEGQPLGLSGDGRVDPIPFQIKQDLTGLGKTNHDVRMIETTVAQRRGLDSERQQKETESQRRAREDLVARKSALESEISTTLRPFYCALCDKQFKTVAQYDEHTNSYAHHHKARFKDMQANVRLKPREDIDKRKEKERKREEKELRKIAAANGIRMAKPTPTVNLDAATSTDILMDVSSVAEGLDSQPAAKKAGWASLASASPPAPPTIPSGNRAPPQSTNTVSNAPAFRTAGWTSLDTGSSHSFPPPPTHSIRPPLPPTSAPPLPQDGSSPGLTRPEKGGWAAVSGSSLPPAPSVAAPPSPLPSNPQPVRSSWQQFQNSAPRKR